MTDRKTTVIGPTQYEVASLNNVHGDRPPAGLDIEINGIRETYMRVPQEGFRIKEHVYVPTTYVKYPFPFALTLYQADTGEWVSSSSVN